MEATEIARFTFGISIFKNPDGSISDQVYSQNKNIREEIILLKLRAFLQQSEKAYFDEFNKETQS